MKRTLGVCLCVFVATAASAAKIITKEDLIQNVIKQDQLVRVADNALFLFDASSSMDGKFRDTDRSKLEVIIDEFKARNAYFPEIGHKFGLYLYTPWKPVYEMQTYDRAKFGAALDTLPTKGSGPTTLVKGLEEAESVLKSLKGRTAVFVFSDGGYSRDLVEPIGAKSPGEIAKDLARRYNVCFYVVSTAKDKQNREILELVASLNSCSRLVEFEKFMDRPEYTIGALFDVKATEKVVTTTEKRVVGLEANDVTFEYDEHAIQVKDVSELEQVAAFLQKQATAFVLLSGYTDNVGSEEYNLALSRRRAQSVADYLAEKGIDADRVVLQWHGTSNPVASNETEEGRAQNRRVEMAVGGL